MLHPYSCALALLSLSPIRLSAQDPAALLSRAIEAAGGADRLTAARAFEWSGTATIHVPGREIHIAGLWRVQPPDSAIVATWEVERGEASTRRLILAGNRGWTQRNGAFAPMDSALQAEERHQFYLYEIMRLVPLLDSASALTSIPPWLGRPGYTVPPASGAPGFTVHRAGHPDISLYFDQRGFIFRILTVFARPDSLPGDTQEITLMGKMESNGVHWFRVMSIWRDGKPYFDLTIDAFRVLPALKDPLLAGPAD